MLSLDDHEPCGWRIYEMWHLIVQNAIEELLNVKGYFLSFKKEDSFAKGHAH